MANIFLTKKCNLKCPYCFADEFVNKENEEFSLDNFNKALEFIKTDINERVGLIGGEPTLHSKFNEILDIIISDEKIKNCIIYTNGLEIDKYTEKIKNPKFNLLVNCNPPEDIKKQYEKLKSNITLLKYNKADFTLGINLYSSEMDYSYIFELLSIADKHHLRFSTALPNSDKEETKSALDEFKKFKPFLFKFFKDCLEHEIVPSNDCNAIPTCLLDNEEKKIHIKLHELSKKYKIADTMTTANTCSPVIDILPDLTAVRCFGLSKYMKVPILKYKNLMNLKGHFFNTIDLYARLSFEKEECENCKIRMLDKCGLCFTYKLKHIEELKKAAKKLATQKK